MGFVQRDDLSCSPLGSPSSTGGGVSPPPRFSMEGAGRAGTGEGLPAQLSPEADDSRCLPPP